MDKLIEKFLIGSNFRRSYTLNIAKLIFSLTSSIILLINIFNEINVGNVSIDDRIIIPITEFLICIMIWFIIYQLSNIVGVFFKYIIYFTYKLFFLKIYTLLFKNTDKGQSDLIEKLFLWILSINGLYLKNMYIDSNTYYEYIDEHQKQVPFMIERNIDFLIISIHLFLIYSYSLRYSLNIDNIIYLILSFFISIKIIIGTLIYYCFLGSDTKLISPKVK